MKLISLQLKIQSFYLKNEVPLLYWNDLINIKDLITTKIIESKTNNLVLHREQRFDTIYDSVFLQEHKDAFIMKYI